MAIKNRIADFHSDMTEWRHDLHAHPETAFEEVRTADLVARKLEGFGIKIHRGLAKTGVVGTLSVGNSNRAIGLRACLVAGALMLVFLFLGEATLPADRVSDALEFIERDFRPNTVTLFGVEHITLAEYRQLLERYRQENQEALEAVCEDLEAGDIAGIPVNWAVVAIKEADGRLRVFLQAKSHPFGGEETIDPAHDLYRGKVFPLFRCQPACFNFMSLICLDYIYRDTYQSNINVIIDRAN